MDWASVTSVRGQREARGSTSVVLKPSLEATWVLVCGLVASGRLQWDGASVLRVVAAWLIVDALVGCVYAQLAILKRARPALLRPGAGSSRAVRVPYAAPGSPAERLGAALGALLPDLREHTLPAVGRNGITAVLAAALALTCAAFLGTQPLAAVAAALLAASGLAALTGGSVATLARGQRGMQVAVAWALGYLVLGPLPLHALGLGLFVGLGAYGRSLLRDAPGTGAKVVVAAVWIAMACSLLLGRQPVPAALVATAGLADHIAMVSLDGVDIDADSMRGRLGWLLSVLILALAVAHWA